jgi:hypothetical protein
MAFSRDGKTADGKRQTADGKWQTIAYQVVAATEAASFGSLPFAVCRLPSAVSPILGWKAEDRMVDG